MLNRMTIAAGMIASAPVFGQQTVVADYEARLASYMKIHAEAQSRVSARSPTEKAEALAEAIRIRRPNAMQGDIFTAAIVKELQRLAAGSLRAHPSEIHTSIRSGEIVPPIVRVNGAYPKGFPVETMPPSLLAALPPLPEPLRYRLMSRTLVLLDAEDKLVVDFIPSFLPEP